MYVVRLYGYHEPTQREELLEEGDYASGLAAMEYIAGQSGEGKRAELAYAA